MNRSGLSVQVSSVCVCEGWAGNIFAGENLIGFNLTRNYLLCVNALICSLFTSRTLNIIIKE